MIYYLLISFLPLKSHLLSRQTFFRAAKVRTFFLTAKLFSYFLLSIHPISAYLGIYPAALELRLAAKVL